jgi:hypothetical protein
MGAMFGLADSCGGFETLTGSPDGSEMTSVLAVANGMASRRKTTNATDKMTVRMFNMMFSFQIERIEC